MAVSRDRTLKNKRSYAGYIGSMGGVPAAPVNSSIPTITGTPRVGQTLTAANGAWSGIPAPTFARQWKADGVNIATATGTTYILTEAELGKVITVTVTGTNTAGNASATSTATAAVIAAE